MAVTVQDKKLVSFVFTVF